MKYFYTHLIEIESIIIRLDKIKLSDEQKLRLTQLLDSTMHHVILDAALSQFQEPDKRVFMNRLVENNHDKIWKFLNEKVEGIETKIKKTVDELKEEFVNDLEEAEKLS